MKKFLKKAWLWLNGKKTIIGSVVTGGLLILDGVKPGLMPSNLLNGLLIISTSIFGVGIGHKGIKSKVISKAINNARKSTPKQN